MHDTKSPFWANPKLILLSLLMLGLLSSRCSDSPESYSAPPPSSNNNGNNGGGNGSADMPNVSAYLTTANQSAKFALQSNMVSNGAAEGALTITLDPSDTYQEIDGFGWSLTGGSAMLLNQMSAGSRSAILEELFSPEGDGIGASYLRVSIGASDLDPQVFSYNDLPAGQTDVALANFDIAPDKQYLIPVLKEILAINPEIKIMGSPWSAPAWMKTNNDPKGGSLRTEYHAAYADYFVKYIEAMDAEGIAIDAITVQNEPLHDGNNPSMFMTAAQQTEFVKNHLGPAFQAAGIGTKIVVWDHNCDNPGYPIEVMDDPEAKQYIDGSAFHLYGGSISAMSTVHNAHPDKSLYFTEQWIGAPGDFPNDMRWHIREVIIGSTRNWSKVALEWNLAADPNQDPHTDGGCHQCLGALTIDGNSVTRNPAYYIVAHASKFARPGATRIGSNVIGNLRNVAFQNEDGSVVTLVLNDSEQTEEVNLTLGDETVNATLAGGSVATFVWEQN